MLNVVADLEFIGDERTCAVLHHIFELNKCDGILKFVLVMSSAEARDATYQSLQRNELYFRAQYSSVCFTSFMYDVDYLGQLAGFASNLVVHIMLVSACDFNGYAGDDGIFGLPEPISPLYQKCSKLGGKRPVDFIREAGPKMIFGDRT